MQCARVDCDAAGSHVIARHAACAAESCEPCACAQRVLSQPAPDTVDEAAAVAGGRPAFRLRLRRIKQLAELHGGGFRILSRPGAGTTVEFTLPAYDATLHARRSAPAAPPKYGLAAFRDRCARPPPAAQCVNTAGHLKRVPARAQGAMALAL